LAGEVDAVFLIFARFKSALTQVPTTVQLLPFSFGPKENREENLIDYIYEPSAKHILDVLLPKQVRTQVYSAMLEAVASEHGARMTAMDSASTNAKEMIDHLTLQFNRARQAAITKELMEIIGGAEALKG
jgi:F-type H+-transporting ATPase subunit gamma